jgi:hypothetical protein
MKYQEFVWPLLLSSEAPEARKLLEQIALQSLHLHLHLHLHLRLHLRLHQPAGGLYVKPLMQHPTQRLNLI